jgi:methylated-DNA-[protein]-cysteine S-methyltransferase
MNYSFKTILTDLGELTLISCSNKLIRIYFPQQEINSVYLTNSAANTDPVLLNATEQLEEYLKGKRRTFALDLNPEGTFFQKKVWEELLLIPYGDTISYQELALRAGSINKARAVGYANSRNPLPIIIPCHRVINKNGRLGGYAGGRQIKQKLLELERTR